MRRAVLIVLVAAVGCVMNPVSGKRELANGVAVGASLRVGQAVKRVVGPALPHLNVQP